MLKWMAHKIGKRWRVTWTSRPVGTLREFHHIRHHSLFTPRDFDLSPYFEVVKLTLKTGFDYRQLNWYEDIPEEPRDIAMAAGSE